MHQLAQNKNFDLVFGSRYEKNAGSDDDTIVTYVGNKIFSFIGKFFSHFHSLIYFTLCVRKHRKS